ncbi:MAG: OsmC family protein [Acidobacteriota bacterium]|jgi:ribosomal protein S12 methylthiotransferase accessory factor
MEMKINFPGGTRVAARFGGFTIETDLPADAGGEGSAPTPFETFLASLGPCAGIYVLGFCRQRSIPVEGIRLIQHAEINPVTGLAETISLDIQLPPDFPEGYKAAVIRAAEQCKVKKHFESPPEIEVATSINPSVPA